jgi:alpha-ribazole phosphatase
MSDVTKLWLIRHAPVDGPKGVMHDADAPADLSDLATFATLRARLPEKAPCIASPSRRTMETATALGFAPQPEPRFREQHFGDWTGRRHDDLARELREAYAAFWRAPAHNRPPGGESFADQIARVGEALGALPQGDVVLVVHSGTVRAALALALELPPESALRFVIDPLSLTRIDRVAKSWRVVGVNC